MKTPHTGAPAWQVLLQQGLAFHRSGKLAEAKARYEQVLRSSPRQPDALHLLGLLFTDTGEAASAVPLLRTAHRANPASSLVAVTLARALAATGNPAEAEPLLNTVLAREPRNTEAQFQRALLLHSRGDIPRAIEAYQALVGGGGAFHLAAFNLGTLLRAAGQLDEARAAFQKTLDLNPSFAPAATNLGCVLQDKGLHAEAVKALTTALAIDSRSPETLVALANSLRALGRFEEAESASRRTIQERPEWAEGHIGLAQTLVLVGREQEAEECYRTALSHAPLSIEVLNNLGNLLRERGRLDEALDLLTKAIELQPTRPQLSLNLGLTFHQLARLDEAESYYRRALALSPGLHEAGLNLAMAHLSRGDFQAGWELYEHRWQGDLRNAVRSFDHPAWNGRDDLKGRTLLLHAEQGLGDTIQFARFASSFTDAGARVILEVQPSLTSLLSSLRGGALVVPRSGSLPSFDLHCPLLSVPRLIGFDPTQISAPVSYLQAPAAAAARWKPLMDELPHPRIGWVWSGNPRHKNDRNRSLPYAFVRSIASGVAGCHVSLQINYRDGDREAMAQDGLLRDLPASVSDFSDTAAAIEQLDLVVTVDTSVAHLAGSLGRPVWLMLPFCPDWRWMQSGTTSCWYPSARLFRQDSHGDWEGVAAAVGAALRNLSE